MSLSKSQPKEQVSLTLKQLNMQWIGDNKIIVLIGPRRSGKTTILLDYLYYNQDMPFCTCISPTDVYNGSFTKHIPSRFIFSKYTPELVANFLKRQHEIKRKQRAAMAGIGDPKYINVDCRGMLIMDDCLADGSSKGNAKGKNWASDTNLRWIFMNGRHTDVTLVITLQYQIGLGPDLRTNIDWVILCRETKRQERDKLWKNYAGIFPTFEMFNQIFESCTQDKRAMVIDCLSQSSKIIDQVFWYQAEKYDDFRVCYDEFWRDNEKYIQKRMAIEDPSSSTAKALKDQEDEEHMKMASSKSKIKYKLNLNSDPGNSTGVGSTSNSAAEGERVIEDDYQYAAAAAGGGGSSYGYGPMGQGQMSANPGGSCSYSYSGAPSSSGSKYYGSYS